MGCLDVAPGLRPRVGKAVRGVGSLDASRGWAVRRGDPQSSGSFDPPRLRSGWLETVPRLARPARGRVALVRHASIDQLCGRRSDCLELLGGNVSRAVPRETIRVLRKRGSGPDDRRFDRRLHPRHSLATAGGGPRMGCPSCDAGVGLTYLLQYKVSRYTTKLAGGNSKFWHAHGQPYYRFPLHVDRFGDYTQHQLLLDAAALGVEPVYCAPRFFETRELVAALQGGAVILRSELIPVTSLGPVASDQPHSVTYPADRSAGPPQVHSQPRRGRRLERLGDEDGQTRVSLDESLFYELSGTGRRETTSLGY